MNKECACEVVNKIKREAIQELLALHYKKREDISSGCDTLIDIVTVNQYLEKL